MTYPHSGATLWSRFAPLGLVLVTFGAPMGCNPDAGSASGSPSATLATSPPTASEAAVKIGCDGPRRVNDPKNVALFPKETGDFCIDPTGSDRGYGEGAKNAIDAICNLFDGECSIYQQHGVRHVIELRYVDAKGSGSTIDVKLSAFRDADAAFAMFTRRVVGDGDPAHPDSAKPLTGGTRAALGWGNAFVWRGAHLAEIMFNDMTGASDRQLKARADRLLPPLVEALGNALPGERELPPSAKALPTEQQLPLGIRYLDKSVAGVEGTGAGAFGYYGEEKQRWRLLSIVKSDEDDAKDVLASFGRLKGAAKVKGVGARAWRLMLDLGGAQTEWIVARKGTRVLGIGDEPRVLRRGLNPEEYKARTLPLDDKRARLIALLR
jgi:Family of unknown function (DUF6599)